MKVEILKLDHFGRGITYLNDKICFVENALPGEIVKIKVIKETKKYLLAKVVDYYRLSDDRVDDVCCYSDVCGGCDLRHLSISAENNFKCVKVKEILNKFAGISSEKILDTKCLDDCGYRNKVILHGKDNVLGYYARKSNRVVGIETCLLANKKINNIIEMMADESSENDISEVLIKTSNDLDEMLVSIKGNVEDFSNFKNIVDTLIINDEVLLGDGSIISNIGNKRYYVSAESFFQINSKLTKFLYDEVLDVVKAETPKKILDLYCGTGTIGIYVSDYVGDVVGVDVSQSSISDANKNKELNSAKNVTFICDKVENVIGRFTDIDMVVVDPPRAGLDEKTIEHIKRIGAKTFVYISCDPVTLARDLKDICSDYEVIQVKPYNMFPRTYHVENFVLLQRKMF